MSKLDIYTIEQTSPAWLHARLGIITASNFGKVISRGRGASPSKTKKSYMLQLVAETLTEKVREKFPTYDMVRGILQEPDARAEYEFRYGIQVDRVGFAIKDGYVGCSPDGLVGPDGAIEIKSVIPEIQIETVIGNKLPTKHKPQVQGTMYVFDLNWVDFVSYSPLLDQNFLFVIRVLRDDKYIDMLREKIDKFHAELNEMIGIMKNRRE